MNNPLREVNWGLFGRRSFAFLIDFLLFLSVMTVLIRIFNTFVPGNDVREDPMQLYTQKDFRVFVATFCSVAMLMISYLVASYLSKSGQTIGHRVAGIRILTLSGQPIKLWNLLRVTLVACIRLAVLVVPGPFFAYWGGEVMGSVFLLIWGAVVILPIPVRRSRPLPLTLWEALGNYHFELMK